jgi:BirA family biotin operon repressor/biotin-[acetyl-CoA-carboxylase] ligase
MSIPAALQFEISRVAGRLGAMAGRVRWCEDVTSTNDVALDLAARGGDEGLVIAAAAQTAGRGRLGRGWSSPPDAGVYASVLLRPPPQALPLLTLAAGVGVADGIEAATGLAVALKWPNDLYAPGTFRKLGGILAERGGAAAAPHVVVGFGLNVRPAPHEPAVAARATSLEEELGRPVEQPRLLVESLAAIWQRYRALCDHQSSGVLDAWRERAAPLLGRRVEWDADGRVETGVAGGVDDAGALIVRTSGTTVRILSGEVRWR